MLPVVPVTINEDSVRHTFGLIEILVALSNANVDFVVCGGVACILQGVSRTTADLDCCVAMDDANLRRMVDALRPMGFRLRAPEPLDAIFDAARRRAWLDEKQAMVATLVSDVSSVQVDVFLRYPVGYDTLRSQADIVDAHGVRFAVSSKQHLVDAKRAVVPPRVVDQRDIADLEQLLHDK